MEAFLSRLPVQTAIIFFVFAVTLFHFVRFRTRIAGFSAVLGAIAVMCNLVLWTLRWIHPVH